MSSTELKTSPTSTQPEEIVSAHVDINGVLVPRVIAQLLIAEEGIPETIPTSLTVKILGVSKSTFNRNKKMGLSLMEETDKGNSFVTDEVLQLYKNREEARGSEETKRGRAFRRKQRNMNVPKGYIPLGETLKHLSTSQSSFYDNEKYGLVGTVFKGREVFYEETRVLSVKEALNQEREAVSREKELVPRTQSGRRSRAKREKLPTETPREQVLKTGKAIALTPPNPFLEGLDEVVAKRSSNGNSHTLSADEEELRYYAGILLDNPFKELTDEQQAFLEQKYGGNNGQRPAVNDIARNLEITVGKAEELDNEMVQKLRIARIQAKLGDFASSTESGTPESKLDNN